MKIAGAPLGYGPIRGPGARKLCPILTARISARISPRATTVVMHTARSSQISFQPRPRLLLHADGVLAYPETMRRAVQQKQTRRLPCGLGKRQRLLHRHGSVGAAVNDEQRSRRDQRGERRGAKPQDA